MNRKISILPILITIFCITSCKKHDNGPIDSTPTADYITAENNRLSAAVTSQTITAFISGTVVDETGQSLSGVSVTAGNATVTTNDRGYFQFPGSVTVNKDYAIITATLSGYLKATKTFTPNTSGKANHYFEIRLLKPGTQKTVASTGGDIVLDNKIELTFPDGAVVTSTGAPYSGQYNVSGRYLDPAAPSFPETMPGLLAGLNDLNQLQALESFGIAAIELKDASGNPLQIAPGKSVTLKLPAPANGPATIPLWHFNDKYGMWIQAGTATKTGDTYTAEVSHFSIWDLALELNSFQLYLQFKDVSGNPLSGLKSEAYMNGSNVFTFFYSDNEGKATLINCPSSQPLIIKTFFQCDTAVNTLAPVTASRSETITVPTGPGLKSYTLTGKLSNCSNAALPNQAFQLAIQGDGSSLGLPGVTDAQGNYTLTGMICNNSNTITAQASAFIDNAYRYAAAASLTLPNTAYNAQICDTAAGISDNFEIVFPDPALDSLIREKINKPVGPVFYGDVKNIDSLITFAVISDLSGIQFCTNLKLLDLRGGANFSDLGLLKNLVNLQGLFITEEKLGLISDISPLQNLTQLQALSLQCANLSDISPLRNLVHLQSLSIVSSLLSDISPLANLTQINWLELTSDALTDLSPLQNFTNLTTLQTDGKQLTSSNFSILANFTKLTDLWIRATSISDFSFVKNLPQLQYLHLDANQISDVSQFATLTNLISLELSQNKIADISSLQSLAQLQYLTLAFNQITDISSLKNLSSAFLIDLDNNTISDVSPLQNLNTLQYLLLKRNQVSNINPLINGVPNLLDLELANEQQGPITQAQQDAFKSSHPSCNTVW